jgi:cysteine desulfurase
LAGGRHPESRQVICSAIEHAAVGETCRAVERGLARTLGVHALNLQEAPVDSQGILDLDAFASLCDASVSLVSVMAVNNEIGTIQPVNEIARLAHRQSPGSIVHTDAVQAVAYLDIAVHTQEADLLSLSAHKIGGPKGVGALVVRNGAPIEPMFHGGGQEHERRSGTQDVAGAVGLALALELATRSREEETRRLGDLRTRLIDGILACVDGVTQTVPTSASIPSIVHLRFAGVEREELLVLLDRGGVCASGGAACASGALEPSHVLAAMGIDPDDARSAIRFSLGYTTSQGEVDQAIPVIERAVASLRNVPAGRDRAAAIG